VKVSSPSSYRLFEKGLANVPSDTVCLPAKLAHGHVQDLIEQGVDRIFFPMMVHMPVENSSAQGTNVCALVQGYPNVIAQSDEPAQNSGVIYDYPPFLWMEERHKRRQTVQYLEGLGVPRSLAKKAYKEGTKAQRQYQAALSSAGESVLDLLEGSEAFGVVLAGRPYHSDELINHDLAGHFTRQGIPVLSLDSLPQIHQESLEQSRVEAFNPFHTRMLSAALSVAQHPNLEMVQLVSFGCGHDAILSDEVDRILKEKGEKSLLVLKLDEGENHGPLSIRVKSYIETIRNQRKKGVDRIPKPFSEAFPVKFTAGDRQIRSIAVPNLSPAFSLLTANIIQKEGYQAQVLPLADERAFALGKKFVHNDICFPAQVNIGEMLAALERGLILPGETALGLSNTCEDCRAGHYIPLARKALDDAGYSEVPIITPGKDSKNLHPGFRLSPFFHIRMAWGVAMLDGLEMMVRALRPYEIHPGETDRVFEEHLSIISALVPSSLKKAKKALGEAVSAFNNIHVDRRVRKPRCGILGEILMNFHPTANGEVERYLESHGMEVVLPTFTDFFRRKHVAQSEKHRRGILPNRFMNLLISGISNAVFKAIRDSLYKILQGFKFYEHRGDTQEIMDSTRGMIDQSFMAGESWLMAGEILMLAEEGVRSFVILNPFGCLPNHVTGRGLIKPIKQRYPDLQILPLDFDPDTSFSNIENRLQMLVINAREMAKAGLG
jgi:predicted nucleotide-binding protein (sugar kinase/HSP70/actin superfamily)